MRLFWALLCIVGTAEAEAATNLCADTYAQFKLQKLQDVGARLADTLRTQRLLELETLRKRSESSGIDDGPYQVAEAAIRSKDDEIMENAKVRQLRHNDLKMSGTSREEIWADAAINKYDEQAQKLIAEKASLSEELYKLRRMGLDDSAKEVQLARLEYAQRVRATPEYRDLLRAQKKAVRESQKMQERSWKLEKDFDAGRGATLNEAFLLSQRARKLGAQSEELGSRRTQMENFNTDPASWLGARPLELGAPNSAEKAVLSELEELQNIRAKVDPLAIVGRPFRLGELALETAEEELNGFSQIRRNYESDLRNKGMSRTEILQDSQAQSYRKQVDVLVARRDGLEKSLRQIRLLGLNNVKDEAELALLQYQKRVRATERFRRILRYEKEALDEVQYFDDEARVLREKLNSREISDPVEDERLLKMYQLSRKYSDEATRFRAQRARFEDPSLDPSTWIVAE